MLSRKTKLNRFSVEKNNKLISLAELQIAETEVVDADPRTHRRAHRRRLPVGTFSTGGPVRIDRLLHGFQVLDQLVFRKVRAPDSNVDVARFIGAVLDFATLEVFHGRSDIRCHGAGLGVGHETTGAQGTTEARDLRHQVRGRNKLVEIHHATCNRLDQIVFTNKIGAGFLGSSSVFCFAENGDAEFFSCACGEANSGAELLVGVFWVDVEAGVISIFVEVEKKVRFFSVYS